MTSTDRGAGLRLVNLSELDPAWQWLKPAFEARIPDWHHVSTQSMRCVLPVARAHEARLRAALEARRLLRARSGPRVLVSHGPRPAEYWGLLASGTRLDFHDVSSFNFTDMPTGATRFAMSRAFRHVDRFVVSSSWEREFYADWFSIPVERMVFQHWGVRPPDVAGRDDPPLVAGDYVCAIGSQARDYATLVEAVRGGPTRLVIVASPHSMQGIAPAPNVEVRTNIPLDDAMNILKHSRAMVLPMNSATARCGHVTAVSAMHLGVPIISTDCRGLDDYLVDGRTARLVPQGDPAALAGAIAALLADAGRRDELARAGRAFAQAHCMESNVVEGFRRALEQRGLAA